MTSKNRNKLVEGALGCSLIEAPRTLPSAETAGGMGSVSRGGWRALQRHHTQGILHYLHRPWDPSALMPLGTKGLGNTASRRSQ